MMMQRYNYRGQKTKSFEHYPFLKSIKDIDRSKYIYSLCVIHCLVTGFTYYWMLKGFKVINDRYINSPELRSITIDNPAQYIKPCLALYQDIILYGKDNFDVHIRITNANKESVLYWIEWHTEYNNFTYNAIELQEFNWIMCIETNEIFETPGQAAKSVGLKSKTSILNCLNNPDKTAAKLHWVCLDKL